MTCLWFPFLSLLNLMVASRWWLQKLTVCRYIHNSMDMVEQKLSTEQQKPQYKNICFLTFHSSGCLLMFFVLSTSRWHPTKYAMFRGIQSGVGWCDKIEYVMAKNGKKVQFTYFLTLTFSLNACCHFLCWANEGGGSKTCCVRDNHKGMELCGENENETKWNGKYEWLLTSHHNNEQ